MMDLKRICSLKFTATIAFGAMCMMAACSGEQLEAPIVEESMDGSHWERADINLNVHRVNFDAQAGATRSADEGWKDGDRIYLILKDKDGNNVQAYVEYDATAASWGQVEYDGYKSYLTCTTPRTVEAYYFDATVDVTASDITFDATTGVYVCTDGVYTYPSDGDLEVSISLVPLTSRIRFVGEADTDFTILNGMKTYTGFSRTTGKFTETEESNVVSVNVTGSTPYIYGIFADSEKPSLIVKNNGNIFKTVFEPSTNVLQVGHSGYMTLPTVDSHRGWKQIIPATRVTLDRDSLVVPIGETTTLNAFQTPANANSDIIWLSSDNSVATVSDAGVVTAVSGGTATITAKVEDSPNIKTTCEVTILDANGHAYVNLGLTSGTLWATMNVGASSPSDYGDYFAWGEVTGYNSGKSSFDWSTYKYCKGTDDTMTKYCTISSLGNIDNKTELELSDDVARYNWGGSWRMPSESQFEELEDECTWTWTTQDGISGFLVSSKKNSNSLFLPAAGYRSTNLKDAGVEGYYWLRSLSVPSRGECWHFYSFNILFSSRDRCHGQGVRPVLGSE